GTTGSGARGGALSRGAASPSTQRGGLGAGAGAATGTGAAPATVRPPPPHAALTAASAAGSVRRVMPRPARTAPDEGRRTAPSPPAGSRRRPASPRGP